MSEVTNKRYCKTLTVKDDPQLIKEYTAAHSMGQAWPEVTQGMKDIGICDMEIYIFGNRLFMIMETTPDFDHDSAFAKLAKMPRQSEWEASMAKFQNTSADASAEDKWQLMERIYKMDQKQEHRAIDGQFIYS
ncbi:L-rhamnose mutarotase [Lentisphaera profundi]|uniref:L-rhamnose mutarotase n=1 Tax=Lentisphaera profundi TaxID=1658616 RepID=A0ABY7VSA9_9BACT|nr:L-rhamnose mutarotase [Lentisphaera profundi]WDE96932.1 L-rhamnose mutarotase [Lentisphaera profundi]